MTEEKESKLPKLKFTTLVDYPNVISSDDKPQDISQECLTVIGCEGL